MDKQTLIKEILDEIDLRKAEEIRIRPEVLSILTSQPKKQACLYLNGVPVIEDDSLQIPWKVIFK